MYPKFRPVNNFAEPIFSSSKHSHLPLKMFALSRGQIDKFDTEWFARRWWQIRRIVVVENSPVIFRIFIYFVIPSLQSVTSCNSTKHKVMTRKSERWFKLLTSSGFLWTFTLPLSLGHFWEEKQLLDCWNSRNFWETYLKFTIFN